MDNILLKLCSNDTTLTELYLGFNGIGAIGASHLSDALKINTTLTELDLGSNGIGAIGANHLSDALKINTTLTELNLWSNKIGAIGANHLSNALKYNCKLLVLNIDNPEINSKLQENKKIKEIIDKYRKFLSIKVIYWHLREAYYRPDGIGFLMAREHFFSLVSKFNQ